MRPFRFRAAAALDFTRKQEDDARTALTRAEIAHTEAEARLRTIGDSARQAEEALVGAQRAGASGWLIGWHRSWIARQHADADAQRQHVAACTDAVARATAVVRDAHRRRRTLERFRDRAWRRYQTEATRHDARQMDALAGSRHHAQTA